LKDHRQREQNGALQTARSVNYFVNQVTLGVFIMSIIKIAPGAKLTNSGITGNTQVGGNTMIDNQGEIEGGNIERNIHIAGQRKAKKRWFEKPLGILLLGVVASLLAWAVLHYYGLA